VPPHPSPSPQDDDPPGEYDLREIDAQCRQAAENQARAAATAGWLGLTGAIAAVAALNGRRGPGQRSLGAPGSRRDQLFTLIGIKQP
jgi:hypothetical protein